MRKLSMTTFTVAGVSIHKDSVKVRFCSDLILRIKNLQKQGDTDIQLIDLPSPMTKLEACQYLLNDPNFSKYAADISEIMKKKETVAAKPKLVIEQPKTDPEIEKLAAIAG